MKIIVDLILKNTLDIDLANAELFDFLSEYDLKGKILNLNGPAGGNPEIELEGDEEKIKTLLFDIGAEDLI